MEQDDHRAGCLLNDLLDHPECVVGALAEPDERDIRPFSRRNGPDVLDLDLPGDHLVPECGDDRRHQLQAILPLVRDQNAQMFGLPIAHTAPQYLKPSPDRVRETSVGSADVRC